MVCLFEVVASATLPSAHSLLFCRAVLLSSYYSNVSVFIEFLRQQPFVWYVHVAVNAQEIFAKIEMSLQLRSAPEAQ